MPLFDYRCPSCGLVREVLVRRVDDVVKCINQEHWQICVADEVQTELPTMTRLQSAPARVLVNGFSSLNGYSANRTIHQDHGNGLRTEVKGNFEGFSDGLA
jgi:hypothetical protein